MPSPTGYSRLQIRLHWIIAALIILQYLLHESIVAAWELLEEGGTVDFSPLIASHVFGGLLVLVLALWRLVVRMQRGAPVPPEEEHPALKMAAAVIHWSFYALMIVMPITGALAWFGRVDAAAGVHSALRILLLALFLIHVVAALYHQFVLKTNVMMRMKQPEA
ncbi:MULTISPECIES: cytochrome b [Actibacterium]|uniref:Cytochrome b561 n=1 Tax=Actibacterium naphthalenivorans TaxID=1614693 RepID=A0A840CA71_9RHOB|nr:MULTISPECIES: cytochrome b/b6 domain-containing protein [Actibacterium]ALG89415.1 hypothetical protein TQ29_03480 [Actibacterium sp. EMB200-NS6]MBB4020962.1 cytochrome b561 [Actibacterium naphthalenivorans]